jgi:hypothetical protein
MSSKVYQYGLQALSESVPEKDYNGIYCRVWNNVPITGTAGERDYFTGEKDNPTPLESRKAPSKREAVTNYLRGGSKESAQRIRYLSDR